jgi:hypothetical protein
LLKGAVGRAEAICGRLSRKNFWLLWAFAPFMVVINLIVWDSYFSLGEKPRGEVITTTIISDFGDAPAPKVTAEIGSSPEASRKPKRKPTVKSSPSATTSVSATPNTKPSSAPAPSEPATKPSTETPSPDPTTTSPTPDENPTPGDQGDGLPITLPVDPGTIIEGIIG